MTATMKRVTMRAIINAQLTKMRLSNNIKNTLKKDEGSFFTEQAFTIVILIVIAFIFAAGIITLLNATIMPELATKIIELFGFKGITLNP